MTGQPQGSFTGSVATSATSVQSAPLIDTRPLTTTYTNVFRASGSAEEVILDFGLDAHQKEKKGGRDSNAIRLSVATFAA